MMISEFWRLVWKVDGLSGLEAKHDKQIEALRADVKDLTARVNRLEAREDLVVAEARGAASAAAGVTASAYISDVVRRVTLLEAQGSQSRLSPT